MSHYIIIELENGFSVAEVAADKTAIEVAKDQGAVLIDEGPYSNFEEAQEMLATMPNPYEAEEQSFND